MKNLTAPENIYDDAGRYLGRVASFQFDDQPRPYWIAETGRETQIRGYRYDLDGGTRYGGRDDIRDGYALRTRAAAVEILHAARQESDRQAEITRSAVDRAAEVHAASPTWQASLVEAGRRGDRERGEA